MNRDLAERLTRYDRWEQRVRELHHAPSEAEQIIMRYPYGQPIRSFVKIMRRSRAECEQALQHLEKVGKAEVARLGEFAKVWRKPGMVSKE